MRDKIHFVLKYIVPYILTAIIILLVYRAVQSSKTLEFEAWARQWTASQGEEMLLGSKEMLPEQDSLSYYDYLHTKNESIYSLYVMELERNWFRKPIGYKQIAKATYKMDSHTFIVEQSYYKPSHIQERSFEDTSLLTGVTVNDLRSIKRDFLFVVEKNEGDIEPLIDPDIVTGRFETLYEEKEEDGYVLRLCRTYNEEHLPYNFLRFYQLPK